MTIPEPTVTVTRYEVSIFPDDNRRHHYTITVESRGAGRWVVVHFGSCLSADGTWDWESVPSERGDEWLDTHRFDLNTALRLAREAAPHIIVNGLTATDAYRRTHPETS